MAFFPCLRLAVYHRDAVIVQSWSPILSDAFGERAAHFQQVLQIHLLRVKSQAYFVEFDMDLFPVCFPLQNGHTFSLLHVLPFLLNAQLLLRGRFKELHKSMLYFLVDFSVTIVSFVLLIGIHNCLFGLNDVVEDFPSVPFETDSESNHHFLVAHSLSVVG